MKIRITIFVLLILNNTSFAQQYTMPAEESPHEATWLQWPHHYQYGIEYRERLDATWLAMSKALVESENVNIVVYDETEKVRVIDLLEKEQISLKRIHFFEFKTDDFWIRDNGPIYVQDESGKLLIEDWGFNGWGNKAKYSNCNKIPSLIGNSQNTQIIDLNEEMINEGGSVELDGHGTLMATKSAILNGNRNPDLSQKEIETLFQKYLGVSNFIWLEGKAGLEITDMHIDGFARFVDEKTIISMSENDLEEWTVPLEDIKLLYKAHNKNNVQYKIVPMPLTKNNVKTEYGKKLHYKGSYINYYIGNSVILVPNYNDPNDIIANAIIQELYPTRKVVGIDVRNLYANGGMIHCVTQQQPK